MRILGARPPRGEDKLAAWAASLARREVARHTAWRVVDRYREPLMEDPDLVADTVAPAEEPPGIPDLSPWLRAAVLGNETDTETVEILKVKAERDLTYEQAAAAHGLTEAALKKRTARLVSKYGARWQRHVARERDHSRILLALLLLLLFGVAALVLWLLPAREPPANVGPAPVPVLAPLPSEVPVDDGRNIAAPPTPSTPPSPPPRPLKPAR